MRQASDSSAAQKVCRILKTLTTPTPQRLTDISQLSGVNKATALRLLEEMVQEGFVHRDPATKRYSLGEEAALLGLAVKTHHNIRDLAKPAILRLADYCGDTVLLSVRSGCEAICVDREFGGYPIRANYLDPGMRRPLGVGAGSMALLAWLPDEEIETILELNRAQLVQRYPRLTTEFIWEEVRAARERGYTILLDVIVEQMGGLAVPLLGKDGRPYAAISIAGLKDRIVGRLGMLVPALEKISKDLEGL